MTKSNEAWEFFKLNFKWLAAAGLFLFLYLDGCFKRFEAQVPIITYDTTRASNPQPLIIYPATTPQQSGNVSYPIILPPQAQPIQPSGNTDSLKAQVVQLNSIVNDLAKELYAVRNYKDSIQLQDTAGRRVGVVNVEQQVSENKIKFWKPSYQLDFPTTMIVKTIQQPYKPKNQVYIGGGFTSPLPSPSLQQANAGFLFKNKSDNVLGLQGNYNFKLEQPGVTLSYYQKIKL